MFVLIWATLLYSVTGINADEDASVGRKERCQKGYCITLNEGEITAEAGLCVVIPCSFTTESHFTPKNIVWSKCDAGKLRCSDSERIFHTYKNNSKIQPGFRGRVSLLEPDVNQRNCSIIINDLTESDSGSYQLRVNGLKYTYTYTYSYKSDGFTFTPRATISVKDLMQKPTLMIPPLMEGKQTTLTCTAPGLCSGSVPQITWTWRGEGENDSHITGNVTAVKNESVTSVAQRYRSTLTFDPSAEHHGTNVTCKVGFRNNITAEETVTLNVTYLLTELLKTVQQPEVIIAFVTGFLLSAVICCLAMKCCRKKRGSAENLAENLEMITMQETDGIHDQQAAEEEAEATGQPVEPKEVEYSNINFSRLNRRQRVHKETTESEYAEIKTEDIKKRQDSDREDGEIVEANGGKEEEELKEEEKERVEELKEEEKGEEGMIEQLLMTRQNMTSDGAVERQVCDWEVHPPPFQV
ncbi:myeloid cell surface antigen CD33-like [Larimichthys crocea]|uniref:myeloid cell surface antigen CD33-like n=1 Tax=Larimichthys crocea TaxID=215358 RepID=UPI000F600F32|nr:myeloid cell surface antigen CD33-like [Larimichthys crocea]